MGQRLLTEISGQKASQAGFNRGGKNRKANARWKRYCSAKAEKTEHNMPEREQKCQGVTGPAPQMKPCDVPHSSKQVLLEF